MTTAELFEIAWTTKTKTTTFRDLAKRCGAHIACKNKSPLWTEYAFPDGSSIVSYGTGIHHHYKVFTSRRAHYA